MSFTKTFQTLWANFDANKHMRHTAYNDFAAECRVRFFTECGFDIHRFQKENFGPILFKEETHFLKEIKLGEDISIELFLQGFSLHGERFKFLQKIFRQDGAMAAEIKVYGAWIDLTKRKLTNPPKELISIISSLEKTDDYEEICIKSK